MKYAVLAYYRYVDVEDPHGLIREHQKLLGSLDAKGRIYISAEGINGQMSIAESDMQQYIDWMHTLSPFKGLEFKVHEHPEHAFAKMTVKYREQLAALDEKVDWKNTGEHVSPADWKKMLENRDDDTLLLDVRNDYEWRVGHFAGATLPKLEQFREFPAYADELKEEHDPKKTKVMMYCTGGIRCEIYSALMKDRGFDEVYQLDGGVIKYGLEEGKKHWDGNLFVFDDRMVVPLDGEDAPPIDTCHTCGVPSDVYYNCANMDCNALFVSCNTCNEKHKGCCGADCETAPRVRPYQTEQHPKPFRKLPFEEKQQLSK
jgi:UPF0176 protein